MAKTSVVSQLVPFAEVFWLQSNNERSEIGDVSKLRESLSEHGWVDHYPANVVEIQTDDDLSPDDKTQGKKSEQAIAMEERKARWDALKASTTPADAVERQVFERLFVRDGKLIVPKYSGNSAFRRSSCYLAAMVDRFGKSHIPADDRVRDMIPVCVKTYANEVEKIIDQQLENELQGVGTEKISDRDKLKIAKKLYYAGYRETNLRQLYTATTGQKLFGIVRCSDYWPNLKIYDRFMKDSTDADYIPFGPVRHDELIKLNNRKEADDKRKEGRPLTPKEREFEPLSEAEVAQYFADKKAGSGGNAPKIMKKSDIDTNAKQNGVHFFRVAFKSVYDDNLGMMAPYLIHSDALNLHKKLIDDGAAEIAAAALTLANENAKVLSAVNAALARMTADEVLAVLHAGIQSKTGANPVVPPVAPPTEPVAPPTEPAPAQSGKKKPAGAK